MTNKLCMLIRALYGAAAAAVLVARALMRSNGRLGQSG